MHEIFISAIKAIMTNKVRSFLTMLGVIIGVASVTMLTSIGAGLKAYITDEFNKLGANTLLIYPGDILNEDGGFSATSAPGMGVSKITLKHIRSIRSLREHVSAITPIAYTSLKASYRQEDADTMLMGTTANIEVTFNRVVERGRFFTDEEDRGEKRVVVLGYNVADDLFGNIDPIGKRITLSGSKYTVIGVIEKKGGGFGGPPEDDYSYIPLATYINQFNDEELSEIIVKTTDVDNMKTHIRAIENDLSRTLDDDEFSVVDQSEILGSIKQILGVVTGAFGGIAGISLVVGGIGIMNIMLVSVTERTREIGLRKALGATPNIIMLQFLIEAAVLSLFGGLIGLGIAYGGTLALQAFIPAKITSMAIMLALGVSTITGLVFGVAPARRAANLSPIEALRYE